MHTRTTLITLGLLVAAMPFLGFPGFIETIFFVTSGLIITALAFAFYGTHAPVRKDDYAQEQGTMPEMPEMRVMREDNTH